MSGRSTESKQDPPLEIHSHPPLTMSPQSTTPEETSPDRPYPSNLKLLLIGNSAVGERAFSLFSFRVDAEADGP